MREKNNTINIPTLHTGSHKDVIGPIVKKLNSIVSRQYNCDLKYHSFVELKKLYIAPLLDKLKNNQIDAQEGIYLFPMFVGNQFVGAAEISSHAPLNQNIVDRLNDLTKTIIESTLIDLDRLNLIQQLEAQLEIVEESKNVVRIENHAKNKDVLIRKKRDYYEINVPCLIHGESLDDIFKLALDIHSQSHRYAMLPISQIDNSQDISVQDIEDLNSITLFIPNVMTLNPKQKKTIAEYLSKEITKETPLIISGLNSPINEAIDFLGEDLYKRLAVSFIQLDKSYEFYSERPVLDLLLKQAEINTFNDNSIN